MTKVDEPKVFQKTTFLTDKVIKLKPIKKELNKIQVGDYQPSTTKTYLKSIEKHF